MSYQAFDKLLEQLAGRCLGMAGMVQQQVAITVDAVLKLDIAAAKKVLQGEAAIDAEDVEVERQAINLMLLHHPAAQDFRVVFGIVKINADLERIGDCAVNIAQQVPAINYALEKDLLNDPSADDRPEVPRDMRCSPRPRSSNFRTPSAASPPARPPWPRKSAALMMSSTP